MNSAHECHEIEGCSGLFVDAFRGDLLRRTSDGRNAFVLSHYHGDHYGNLPREGKYRGMASIHCTAVTAELLVRVHGVPTQFVIPHDLGVTWTHEMFGGGREEKAGSSSPSVPKGECGINGTANTHEEDRDRDRDQQFAKITFYDANHCPGAAIVLIELPNGKCHLHTGDMRYCEKMKTYPLIRKAVDEKRMDLVYLDTTYGHPKHDFVPQDEAIDTIATEVERFLNGKDDHDQESTERNSLVLLSCYSIGKEKVLWECSARTNQLVYASDKKQRLLQCVQGYEDDMVYSQIISRCTPDPSKSDIHVIPMGMAGELWPYFRPNYRACMEYAQQLEKRYDRIIAFIPTGWALATNWNKKNATSEEEIKYKEKEGSVKVRIRLVSYSEHSAFRELEKFVAFLRPRKIIPTVFSDDNDRRKIENHFRNLVDSTRAKKDFFRLMTKETEQPARPVAIHEALAASLCWSEGDSKLISPSSLQSARITVPPDATDPPNQNKGGTPQDEETPALGAMRFNSIYGRTGSDSAVATQRQNQNKRKKCTHDDHKLLTLSTMGFDAVRAKIALNSTGNQLDTAIDLLLSNRDIEDENKERCKSTKRETVNASIQDTKAHKKTSIKSFFPSRI